MLRNTLLAAAAVLALSTGAAMAQTAHQNAAQHPTWANAHDTDYGYNHYPQ